MPTAVVEVEGLRREYRRFRHRPVVAVDGLDLSVPSGGVFGFLAPNGSGKTTTIRCLLVLAPAGIKEVRDLLEGLAAEGRTVFVSSHILSEVQQSCDQVAIMSGGRCVRAGPVDEVLPAGRAAGLIVRMANLDRGLAALAEAGIAASRDDGFLRVDLPAAEASG